MYAPASQLRIFLGRKQPGSAFAVAQINENHPP
jgi:hypothetical protein